MSDFGEISVDSFASMNGLVNPGEDSTYLDDLWGLANILRREVDRRGIVTTRELLRTVVPILTTLGCDESQSRDRLKEVLDKLSQMKEVVPTQVDGQRGWIKPMPRWIRLGDACGLLLGTLEADKILRVVEDCRDQTARWFALDNPEVLDELEARDVRQQSFLDWLGLPEWASPDNHGLSQCSLTEFWERKCHQLDQEGTGTAPDDGTMRVLRTELGAFFGRPADEVEGRWGLPRNLPTGVHLAVQRGYSEQHWRPLLVRVDNDVPVRAMLLRDMDQLHWLVLARSVHSGQEEQANFDLEARTLSFTYPLPNQLQRVLRAVSVSVGAWRWRFANGVDRSIWRIWEMMH